MTEKKHVINMKGYIKSGGRLKDNNQERKDFNMKIMKIAYMLGKSSKATEELTEEEIEHIKQIFKLGYEICNSVLKKLEGLRK